MSRIIRIHRELSPRERHVARLIANGWTNRQIGAELGVSERTVDTHVRHVLHKLGAVKRAQIASWITLQVADDLANAR